MITYYLKTLKESHLKKIPEFQVGAWIHVEAPTEAEIDKVAKQFHLEPLLLRDATDPFEVPRLEVEGAVTYVFTRAPFESSTETRTGPLLVAIGETFLLTVATDHFSFLDRFFDEKLLFHTTQKTKLFLQIFFHLLQSYDSFITSINRRVRRTSINLENIVTKDIIEFVRFESTLSDFLAALMPTNTILRTLLSGKVLHLYEEDKELVEDLLLQNGQSVEIANSTSQAIGNIRGAYSTIMTNNLNDVIKRLTSFTIILMVPTIISGFFGMNVVLPFENLSGAFFIIFGLTVFIGISFFVIFSKNKWL